MLFQFCYNKCTKNLSKKSIIIDKAIANWNVLARYSVFIFGLRSLITPRKFSFLRDKDSLGYKEGLDRKLLPKNLFENVERFYFFKICTVQAIEIKYFFQQKLSI